ncbi:MAG: pentapeptide repeat-containing protein [Cyanobacteria bacterium J083]|nr:MAG: pentapeptide repeat-containing protein [Cyanobacteria bacterium J083]
MNRLLIGLTLLIAPFAFSSKVQAENPQHLAQLLNTRQCAYCDLSQANLEGKHLIGADLRYANLSQANLSNANLEGADLSWANLRGANLQGTFLSNASLSQADLSYADLTSATLYDAQIEGVNWQGVKIAGLQTDINSSYLIARTNQPSAQDLGGEYRKSLQDNFAIGGGEFIEEEESALKPDANKPKEYQIIDQGEEEEWRNQGDYPRRGGIKIRVSEF